MSKPTHTVVMDLNGLATVVATSSVEVKCKGTSMTKATKIAEEINNA